MEGIVYLCIVLVVSCELVRCDEGGTKERKVSDRKVPRAILLFLFLYWIRFGLFLGKRKTESGINIWEGDITLCSETVGCKENVRGRSLFRHCLLWYWVCWVGSRLCLSLSHTFSFFHCLYLFLFMSYSCATRPFSIISLHISHTCLSFSVLFLFISFYHRERKEDRVPWRKCLPSYHTATHKKLDNCTKINRWRRKENMHPLFVPLMNI